jgi:regulator of sirC expression with transglutaminase-like and TPR domain
MDKSHDGPEGTSEPLNSMHWSQERLSADVHRAVGGTLNMIREVARVSCELDSEMPIEWMIKRTQFFAYELASRLPAECESERDRLAYLNRFLFGAKCFKCLTEISHLTRPSDAFRLSRVLAARAGSPMMLSLLYAFLAEKLGVTLEFIDFNPAWFLRWTEDGRSRYIDVTHGGASIGAEELMEQMHERYAAASLEPLTFDRFMIAYISDLKSALASFDAQADKLLFLQNALIAYQPSNLQLLTERAALNRRLGNFKTALSDLKRYFAFNDRERAPAEVVRLHDELVALLERQ